jgi:hypothetical protein
MAKYVTTVDSYVNGTYYRAAPSDPAVIEVADDHVPSRRWQPMDEAARKALAARGVVKALVEVEEETPKEVVEEVAMSEVTYQKRKRPSDQSPV